MASRSYEFTNLIRIYEFVHSYVIGIFVAQNKISPEKEDSTYYLSLVGPEGAPFLSRY